MKFDHNFELFILLSIICRQWVLASIKTKSRVNTRFTSHEIDPFNTTNYFISKQHEESSRIKESLNSTTTSTDDRYQNRPPIAARECDRPQPPDHGTFRCGMDNFDFICTGECYEGYSFPDGSRILRLKCNKENGLFEPYNRFPSCRLGGVGGSNYGQQQLVDDDLFSNSQSSRNNYYNNYDSGSMNRLSADRCPDLILPENGGKTCVMSGNKWTCTIRCSSGYQFPDGSTQIEVTCLQSLGVWSPVGAVEDCRYGRIDGSDYGQQQLVDDDMFFNSQSSSSSNYYNSYGTDRCPDLILPSNGGKHCRTSNDKWTCTITCSNGYQFPDGSSQIEVTCLKTVGVWSPIGAFEDCRFGSMDNDYGQQQLVDDDIFSQSMGHNSYSNYGTGSHSGFGSDRCPDLVLPSNGGKHCRMSNNKWTCTITCSNGYQFPDGSSQIEVTCFQSVGVWSPIGAFEDCRYGNMDNNYGQQELVDEETLSKSSGHTNYRNYGTGSHSSFGTDLCPTLRVPTNGVKSCRMNDDKWECTFTCFNGYQFPDGSPEIEVTCRQAVGVWSPTGTFEDCTSTSGNGYHQGVSGVSSHTQVTNERYTSSNRGSHGIYGQDLCPNLIIPRNGGKRCLTKDGVWTCSITCISGYQFPDGSSQINVTCPTSSGIWSPTNTFEDCSSTSGSNYGYGGYQENQYGGSNQDLCKTLSSPMNGRKFCRSKENKWTCTASCMTGFKFPDGTTEINVTCSRQIGIWSPVDTFNDCSSTSGGHSGGSFHRETSGSSHGSYDQTSGSSHGSYDQSSGSSHGSYDQKSSGGYGSYGQITAQKLCKDLRKPNNGIAYCTGTDRQRTCQLTCNPGFEFSDRVRQVNAICNERDGRWSPREDFGDCQLLCHPPCENGGTCHQLNQCECTNNYRGIRCQYAISLCDFSHFSRGSGLTANCRHLSEYTECDVSCPAGSTFDNPTLSMFRCTVDGLWNPPVIPTCTQEQSELCQSPPTSRNARIECTENYESMHCSATCLPGNTFENGFQELSIQCVKRTGEWTPTMQFPDCEPICSPECRNGGKCLSHNYCLCPTSYRGDRCEYPLTLCDHESRFASVTYSCRNSAKETSCHISCPSGSKLQPGHVTDYKCQLDGTWIPDLKPTCVLDVSGNGLDARTPEHKEGYGFGQHPVDDAKTVEEADTTKLSKHGEIRGRPEKGLEEFDIKSRDINNEESGTGIFSNKNRASNYKGLCSIWGFYHYRTFDGGLFTYPSTCWHVLASTENDDTVISAKSDCNGDLPCERFVFIQTTHNKYTLSYKEGINKYGVQLDIPLQDNDLLVEYIGRYIVVRTHVGFTIWINEENAVLIVADPYVQGKTGGLCGNYDLQMDGTFLSATGAKTSDVFSFADSWKLSEPDGECLNEAEIKNPCNSETPENQLLYEKASLACEAINNGVFERCKEVLDVNLYFDKCQMDCCNTMSSMGCQCSSLAEFVLECSRAGVDMSHGWRDPGLCPLTCTNNTEYNECGPACTPTCGDQEPACQQEKCVDGCHCAVGTVLENGVCISVEDCPCHQGQNVYSKGTTIKQGCNTCVCASGRWECTDVICPATCSIAGPHITTFDGLTYDFSGLCPHYVVESEALEFYVHVDYDPHCKQHVPGNVCLKSITIQTSEGAIVKIKSTREVSVNEKDKPHLPVSAPGIYVGHATSTYIRAQLNNGLEILWDLGPSIQIYAPKELFNKLKGLCGTYTKNLQDEFLTPEGDVESSVGAFAGKWRVEEECGDVEDVSMEGRDKVCDIFPQRRTTATELCRVLKEEEFSECHDSVDYEQFYEDCLEDVCSCRGVIDQCICLSLSNYANTCARKGKPLSWRHAVPVCGISCPLGQVYEPCANPCAYSCGEIAQIHSDCRDTCVEGCICPQGQTLNAHGHCASVSMCSCLHSGHFYPPEFQQRRGREMCECSQGQWDCHEASTADILLTPPPRVAKSCNPANHEVFTDCVSTCPVTCSNYHHHQPCTVDICESGCKCEPGYILVLSSGKCVRPRDCPCHHAGRSYREGEEVDMDCNLCICRGGTWSCDSKICPGVCSVWGDSHFETFDGKMYDFDGNCDYVLVKARTSENVLFSVVSQNVPCGVDATANCGRSVSISLGETTLILTRTHPLPIVPKNSKLSVTTFGIFILVDTDIGISLQWDKNTRLYITAQPIWKNKLQGLCGDFNSDASDDFRSPSGGLPLVLAKDFADSWRVHKFCKPANQPQDACEENPERRSWSTEKCDVLKSDLFRPCHLKVEVEDYYKRCVQDTCACNSGGDCECLCSVISAYALKCARKGVIIPWRSQELCPIQCEACDQYSPCISLCPPPNCDTYLDSPDEHSCSKEYCVEGCEAKPCELGHVRRSASNSTCVPIETCGQTPCINIDGVSYREGQRIEKEEFGDPCQSCYCRQGKVECVGVPCQKVTTFIPPSTETAILPEECIDGWTDWINSVHPKENFGNDIESLLSLVHEERSPCPLEYIKNIECRVADNSKSFDITAQDFTCNIPQGLSCNKTRNSRDCYDYEMRFYCQCEEDRCPLGEEWKECAFDCKTSCQSLLKDLKANELCAEGEKCAPGCVEKVCQHPYVSRDDVTCVTPEQCTCKLPSGNVLAPGQVVTNGCKKCQCLNNSLICDKTLECKDEVKDNLPEPEDTTFDFIPTLEVVTMKPTKVTITPFPSLGLVTSTPACSYWSKWINKRKPRKGKSRGDVENTLSYILVQTEGFCLQGTVTDIQCHESKTDQDYKETGEEGLICDLKSGFRCANKDQSDLICKDYKIRYLCSCDEATTQTSIFIRTTTPVYIYPCSNFVPLINGPNPIPDSRLKASSSYSAATGPDSAKIRKIGSPRTWIPAQSDRKPFIEVDLGEIKGIYGIITRGKKHSNEWVTSYQLLYSSDGVSYSYYQDENDKNKVFSGNFGDETDVKYLFPSPFEAKLVRIEPLTWEGRISLAFELLGCSTDETEGEREEPPGELLKRTECKEPVGLQFGNLMDSQFSASSSYSLEFSPEFSRLGSDSVWAAAESNKQQYLQIDFLDEANITGIRTKGREDLAQWITAYHVAYSNNGGTWYRVKDEDGSDKEFAANFDTTTVVDNDFPVMIRARYIRILPTKWKNWISMQIEILGCYHPQPCRDPMGVDEGQITIYQLSSSSKISESHSASNGRLSSRSSWIPAKYDREQLIQMDLLVPSKINGIITKGDPEVQQWVTSYYVGYSNDSVNWKKVQDFNGRLKEFPGNSNKDSAVINLLPIPVTSRYIRILPIKWHLWTSIRLELLGCYHDQNCREPMGLENGIIAEGQITASSSYDWKTMPSHARINDDSGWQPDTLDRNPYLQVDLLAPRNVSGIVTKGVKSDNYWTSKYKVLSSENGDKWFPIVDNYDEVLEFSGNKDRDTPVMNVFPDLIEARFFRVIPLEPKNKIGLRLELLGCYHPYMCQSPLGMESGDVYDFQLSASSYLNPSLNPSNVRLDSDTAWAPKEDDNAPHIQVDMLVPLNITGLMTRGRNDANEWVKSYTISYSDDFIFWNSLKNDFGEEMEFIANSDSDSTVTNLFPQPLFTRYVRVKPKNYEKKVALRLEILGCKHEEACIEPMGLENSLLSDSHITASSFKSELTNPTNARLNSRSSWSTAVEDNHQYLQIDFGDKRNISAIVTAGNPNIDEWVTSFQVQYSDDGLYFNDVRDRSGQPINFMGNFDKNTPFTNILPETLETRFIRIQPTDWKNGISMRTEILGCYHPYEISTVTYPTFTNEIPTSTEETIEVKSKPRHPGQKEFEISDVASTVTSTYEVVCYNPMEKESTLLDDAKIEASSSAPGGDITRLPLGTRRHRRFSGGWVPKEDDLHPYLFIELPEVKLLTSIYTQGRADQDQWVTSLRIIASLDNKTWLPVFASNGQEIIEGNEDKESVVVHYFRKPVEVKYIKVIPESWHKWPSFRLDLRGCHQTSSSVAPEPLKMCPELAIDPELAENCPSTCPPGMLCDGRDCVDAVQCACFHEGDIFQLGDKIHDPECKECVCALGGRSVCVDKVCPTCPENERPVLTEDCECTCEGCEADKIMCPSSHECIFKQRWCDGISDCFDDEINCPSTTTETITLAPVVPVTVPPPTNATCDVMGKYINTFDSQDITYDICHHIIMKDQRNGTFNVTLHKECDYIGDCKHWLEVKHRNHKVKVFSDLAVEVNGHNYTASVLSTLKTKQKYRNFYIDKIGDQVVIKSLVKGFTVMYNNKGHLKIEVTPVLKTRLGGLCGYYSGKIQDDQKKPDGKLARTSQEFGDSWALEGYEEKCDPLFCPHEVMVNALEQCKKLKEEPFIECGQVLQIDHFIEFCMSSICECLQHKKDTSEKCKCNSFQPFVDECEEKLGPNAVRNWRFKHSCHNDCPAGMEWNDCGPSCQLTCDISSEESLEHCSKKCVSGCFCPPGTVLNEDNCIPPDQCADKTCQGFGDPHFTTFDGLFFPFLAEGSFLIVGDVNNKFSLYGFSRQCALFTHATCLVGLQLDYNGHTVIVKKKKDVQVDDDIIPIDKLPLHRHGMVILGYPGRTFVIVVPQISLEARYFEDNSGFAVKVPSRLYFNKTRGLCGNCNGKKVDEIGDKHLSEFVCSFQTEGDKEECEKSLNELPEIPKQHHLCSNLHNPVFEACHPLLDVELYIDACSFDAVHSGKPKEAMCKTAMEYTRQCCQMGIAVNDWPKELMCDMKCPEDLHYVQCHKGCPQTCASLKNTSDNSACSQLKTDGCFCPEGQVLKGEDCVSPHLCETCDDKEHVPGDRWKEGECKTCFCTPELKVECDEQICPEKPICSTHETLVKIERESEETTCCERYSCAPKDEDCPPPVIPSCVEGEVAKIQTGKFKCPQFKCECDVALCKDVIWPTDLEVGQMAKTINGFCCPKIIVSCNYSSCPSKPKCGSELKLTETEGECCKTYKCKPFEDVCVYSHQFTVVDGFEVPVKSEDTEISIYKPGEKWEDGLCEKCICDTNNGQHFPNCFKELCPNASSSLDSEEYVLREIKVPDKCCPEIYRELCKDKDGYTYQVGEHWSDDDPCISFICEERELGGVQIMKHRTECTECPKNAELIPPSKSLGQCCGICYINKCEENDNLYEVGSVWESANQPCRKAECVSEFRTVKTIYSEQSCPTLPTDCPKNQIVLDEKGCCKICNVTSEISCSKGPIAEEDTIGFFTFQDFSRGGICANDKPIPDILQCSGACHSQSYYSLEDGDFKDNCKCCKVNITINRTIELKCPDGSRIRKTFLQPESCQCSKCAPKNSVSDLTGTFTKNKPNFKEVEQSIQQQIDEDQQLTYDNQELLEDENLEQQQNDYDFDDISQQQQEFVFSQDNKH